LICALVAVVIHNVPSNVRVICTAGAAQSLNVHMYTQRGNSCTVVTTLDITTSRGDLLHPDAHLLGLVTKAAHIARIDPGLLLAVLIRESGDIHIMDWLAQTAIGSIHPFSVGMSNMEYAAFEEARRYSQGTVDFSWLDIAADPDKAIIAAAFLLAKRTSQLSPDRNRELSDAEYVRIGYRAGYDVMQVAEARGQYPPGVELFDLAYANAGAMLHQPGTYGPTRRAPVDTDQRSGCDIA
jgi:hypothetical protein